MHVNYLAYTMVFMIIHLLSCSISYLNLKRESIKEGLMGCFSFLVKAPISRPLRCWIWALRGVLGFNWQVSASVSKQNILRICVSSLRLWQTFQPCNLPRCSRLYRPPLLPPAHPTGLALWLWRQTPETSIVRTAQNHADWTLNNSKL